MIKSFANAATRRFYESNKSSFTSLDVEKAHELLAALDEAIGLHELSPLKSIGLHKLKGDRKHQWAMTINGPWRVCFQFKDGEALDVEIVDYHKG